MRRAASPLTLLLFFILGTGAGLLMQVYRSGAGHPPFAPPYSLPATLVVLIVVLVILAVRLRRAIAGAERQRVNPFHAVRLLAAARASQFAGLLFAGLGIGLGLLLIGRTIPAAPEVWLPMCATIVASLGLYAAGMFAERVCRVPPDGDDGVESDESADDPHAEGDVSPAFREE